MTIDDLKIEVKNILKDVTEERLNEIIQNIDTHNLKKSKIKSKVYKYLKEQYNISSNLNNGQKNYWILRGFSIEDAEKNSKLHSKKFDCNSVESVCKRYKVTEQEALQIIKDRSEKGQESLKKNKSAEELEIIYKKRSSISLDNLINKYGKELGLELHIKRKQNLRHNRTLEGCIKRHGEELGVKIYESFSEQSRIQNTLEGYILKHGEELGIKLWKETNSKKSKAHTLFGYIQRYGVEEGQKRFEARQCKWQNSLSNKSFEEIQDINKRKGRTYLKFINEYGELETQKILAKRSIFHKASKESLKLFLPLYKFCRKIGIQRKDIYIGLTGSREWYIRDSKNFFLYDFTIPKFGVIIEFNGIKFHAKDPNETNWQCLYSGISAKESYEKDKAKFNLATKNGFKLFVVWSTDNIKQKLIELKDTLSEENQNYLQRILSNDERKS